MMTFMFALGIFLIAFLCLAIGILFGRGSVSSSCSSNQADSCLCGDNDECTPEESEKCVNITIASAQHDSEKYQQILDNFEQQPRKDTSSRQQ